MTRLDIESFYLSNFNWEHAICCVLQKCTVFCFIPILMRLEKFLSGKVALKLVLAVLAE